MRWRLPWQCSAWVPTPISDTRSAATALQRFEQRFSLYNFGRQTENFYREVLDEWRGRSGRTSPAETVVLATESSTKQRSACRKARTAATRPA